MMEKTTEGSVGRHKEFILSHEETPWMFWELRTLVWKAVILPPTLKSLQRRWTQGLKKKRQSYTMGLSGTLLITIIWVQQR